MRTKPSTSGRRTDRYTSDDADRMGTVQAVRSPMAGDIPLAAVITPLVREGALYDKLPDDVAHCFACGHQCKIRPGARGICQVRYNLDGRLQVPWGYVGALQCDPTEKKPFFHILPGSETLTFGMLGCDLHCPYCQNWDISQAMRDSEAGGTPRQVSPAQLVSLAQQHAARCVASSYNEPLITSEWGMAIFSEAQKAGFTCMYVSNGNATRQVLEFIRPYTDGYKIDLKTMNAKNYRKLGAVLDVVLDAIRTTFQLGFWLEIVTLIVPGFNDSDQELREAARFIKSVSPDIPWHVTAFHKDYKMLEPDNTDAQALIHAAEIGYSEGLHYVYAGNRPGQVGPYENTRCPACQTTLIERWGFHISTNRLGADGHCPHCQAQIPGIWAQPQRER